MPPFDFTVEREAFPNDRSVETTVTIVAFYRRLTITYSRPTLSGSSTSETER